MMNSLVKLAYKLRSLLQKQGYRAGVAIGAESIAIIFKISNNKYVQFPLTESVLNVEIEFLVAEIVQMFSEIN